MRRKSRAAGLQMTLVETMKKKVRERERTACLIIYAVEIVAKRV